MITINNTIWSFNSNSLKEKVLFDNESKKLHAKLCLIDDNIIYTGSHNFTFSAMKRNSESSVRITSKNEAEKIKEYFTKIQE